MSDENIQETAPNVEKKDQIPPTQIKTKTKRDIVHFAGERPAAINFEHVTSMRREGKTIFFDFYNKTQPIDMDSEDIAKNIYQALLNMWSGEINVAG
jgi:hypothetical protein